MGFLIGCAIVVCVFAPDGEASGTVVFILCAKIGKKGGKERTKESHSIHRGRSGLGVYSRKSETRRGGMAAWEAAVPDGEGEAKANASGTVAGRRGRLGIRRALRILVGEDVLAVGSATEVVEWFEGMPIYAEDEPGGLEDVGQDSVRNAIYVYG